MNRVPDGERQAQAIHNAFKVACLKDHNKPNHWVAQHYHDLRHIPHTVTDPQVYHDALESARIRHNADLGIIAPNTSHLPHLKALEQFYAYFYAHHPHLTPSQSLQEAKREVQVMQLEIEEKLMREKPHGLIDENDVFRILERRLKNYVKDHKESAMPKKMDPIPGMPEPYHPWLQHSLYGIADAAKNIDFLHYHAANDSGRGHSFRDAVAKGKSPFLGPRQASYAWYLLAPNKSDLAHIDGQTLDALGYKPKDYVARDYGLYERQLAAGRDASGYEFMPLGLFQKGLIEQRYGPHDDEHFAVWDPKYPRHDAPDITPQSDWPQWWKDTDQYRNQAKKDWDSGVAQYHPEMEIIAVRQGLNPGVDLLLRWTDRTDWFVSYGEANIAVSDRARYNIQGAYVDVISNGNGESWIELSPELMYNGFVPVHDLIDVPARRHSTARVRVSTVGPTIDNQINDPLANQANEPIPEPSSKWEDICPICGGAQVTTIGDRLVACPQCTEWKDHQMFEEQMSDPATTNPEPGMMNPGIAGA